MCVVVWAICRRHVNDVSHPATGLPSRAIIRSPAYYRTIEQSVQHAQTLLRKLRCNYRGLLCILSHTANEIVQVQVLPEYIERLIGPGHALDTIPWVPVVNPSAGVLTVSPTC